MTLESAKKIHEKDRLATFLLSYHYDEIGNGDPIYGGSAVDVAIRLLTKK